MLLLVPKRDPNWNMPKPLIIVGAGDFAEIACEYFRRDTDWRTVGFAVNREYIKSDSLLGLPVVAFEDCELGYPPESHATFVALIESKLNRDLGRLFAECGRKGDQSVSYASPHAFVDPEPVLDLGVVGAFDDCGVVPNCLLAAEDRTLLYTIGFQRCEKVPVMMFGGLAAQPKGSDAIERISQAPLLPRHSFVIGP